MARCARNLRSACFSAHLQVGKTVVAVFLFDVGAKKNTELLCGFRIYGNHSLRCSLPGGTALHLIDSVGCIAFAAVGNRSHNCKEMAGIDKGCGLTDSCPAKLQLIADGRLETACFDSYFSCLKRSVEAH